MGNAASGAGGAIGAVIIVGFLVISIYKSVYLVKEKEQIIIERFGKFHDVLLPGMHFIVPWIDAPRPFSFRYFEVSNGVLVVKSKTNAIRVSMQTEVLDFPAQAVISRDNAKITIDAVLQFKVVSSKKMMYTSQNLPHMISRVMMAYIRNVAGMMDVDQIIEDQQSLSEIQGAINAIAQGWGASVESVKIQRVEAGGLTEVLAKKKNADMKNKAVIINAKAAKQTKIIEAEGNRDRVIKEAEGKAQQLISRARGQAQAILNAAQAEASSIREIARALSATGEDPAVYLLAMKYTAALKAIMSAANTSIDYVPSKAASVLVNQSFGLNTILPTA